MGNRAPALEVRQLMVSFGKTPVLWDVSLAFPQGKLVAIVGPNGAGKSTFIRTVLGLVPAVSGGIRVFGTKLNSVRLRVAYVPQRETVDWDFPITVEHLVLMGCYGRLGLFRSPSREDRREARECLARVGMEGYEQRQISQLSGGQQQRVFLARALLQKADLYLMDEPFSGIDLASEEVIMNQLKQMRDQGKTVCVVHHDLTAVKAHFDWVALLHVRLIAQGPVEEVFTAENIQMAYGKTFPLLEEAIQLSQNTQSGV